MNEIRLLDKNTIDQIAAGEVVDRPSSIIKELVENSIDAGASAVSVEIRDGGISLIRITDNGSGIPKEQISLAFLRHSTSKIRDAADLSFIHTLGFRGEALSSIAAVSRTQLCTKTPQALTGTIYKINGGAEESIQDAGLPDGTTVIVKDLFYNTPARLKFLKSPQTEAGYITDVIHHICLSHPEIAFKYSVNGSLKVSTPGNGSLKDVIYAIFGRDITGHLLEVDDADENLAVRGFLGKPEIARGNRGFEYLFVNGRFIRDRILQKALEEAYIGYQMKGTFPFAVINIRMEPELVDVNVHPSKMEVRFFNNEAVFRSVYQILRRRITERESIPSVQIGKQEPVKKPEPQKPASVPEPFEKRATSSLPFSGAVKEPFAYKVPLKEEESQSLPGSRPEAVSSPEPVYDPGTMHSPEPVLLSQASGRENGMFRQSVLPDTFLDPVSRPKHRIAGVVFDTYWIVEFEDHIYIMDQHAAHEKVLYERIMKRLASQEHYSQSVLPPLILTLSSSEEAILQKHMEAFQETGFEVFHFGGSEYALRSVPADLYTVDWKRLFLEMLEDLKESSSNKGPEVMRDRIATAACKAAVKGGNRLSVTEADALIAELLELDNPYNCPHGRPTMIRISRSEIERKFKRIV